jgi:hypothetical protein
MELLDYIRSGIKTTDFFDYNGHILTIRPITSMEVDDAKSHGYQYVDPVLAKVMVQLNLGQIKGTDKLKDVPPKMYINIDKFNRELNYWIVYHGMKDFMPEDFSIEDVRKMQYVHKIAKQILSITSTDTKSVVQIIKTEEGQELARLIWRYNVPLVKDITELTPLQHQFLIWSDPKAPQLLNSIDKELPEFGKLINNVGNKSN